MLFASMQELQDFCAGVIQVDGDKVTVLDAGAVRADWIDRVIHNAVFQADHGLRDRCRWLIRTTGQELGAFLASIEEMYRAKAQGAYQNVAVPAINIRGLTMDVARAVLRAMAAIDGGPVLFEIARSEIGYTFQRPAEYGACIMAAAIKEGYTGPLFVQGDHFQVNAKKYAADPAAEVAVVKDLIREAIEAGFYNIDVDTSTLVDLSHDTQAEQQRLNYEVGAELTRYIRELEPAGVTVSVGGEIGEVGKKNSTVEELRAYADGLEAALGEVTGISKISVQSGTSHGGVPLPDGSVADVALDFDVLRDCGAAAMEYGMAGSVQHGASTLPDEAFNRFADCDAAEVHLATGFQNIQYDGGFLPDDLKAAIYGWIDANLTADRKDGQTDEQFHYKTRKKGYGPFKAEWWGLSAEIRDGMAKQLEDKFLFLFEQMGLRGSRKLLDHVKHVRVDVPAP